MPLHSVSLMGLWCQAAARSRSRYVAIAHGPWVRWAMATHGSNGRP
jgi:hypothetical protein